jgi:hypothetical protein
VLHQCFTSLRARRTTAELLNAGVPCSRKWARIARNITTKTTRLPLETAAAFRSNQDDLINTRQAAAGVHNPAEAAEAP